MTIYIVEKDWLVEYGVDSSCYAFATKQEAIDFAANFDFEDDELIIESRSFDEEEDGTCFYTYTLDPDSAWKWYHSTKCTFTISPYELGSGEQAHGAMYFE